MMCPPPIRLRCPPRRTRASFEKNCTRAPPRYNHLPDDVGPDILQCDILICDVEPRQTNRQDAPDQHTHLHPIHRPESQHTQDPMSHNVDATTQLCHLYVCDWPPRGTRDYQLNLESFFWEEMYHFLSRTMCCVARVSTSNEMGRRRAP